MGTRGNVAVAVAVAIVIHPVQRLSGVSVRDEGLEFIVAGLALDSSDAWRMWRALL